MEDIQSWIAKPVSMGVEVLDRVERAVLKVRERLLRSTGALEAAGIPYAVVDGHAVAFWVATVDEGAVRNTRDVDLLVRRTDLSAIRAAMKNAGFVEDELLGVTMFRDGPDGKPSEAIHLLFSGEKTRPDHLLPAPDIDDVEVTSQFRVIPFQELLILKLMSNRRKDQVHLLDLIDVGLLDDSWLPKLPPELAARLKHILDTPDH